MPDSQGGLRQIQSLCVIALLTSFYKTGYCATWIEYPDPGLPDIALCFPVINTGDNSPRGEFCVDERVGPGGQGQPEAHSKTLFQENVHPGEMDS